MEINNYLNEKLEQVGYLYKYDLLYDFLQDEYRADDYLYNFYSSCVKEIECKKTANCVYELLWGWTRQNKDYNCDIMNSFNTYMNKVVKIMINKDQSFNDAYVSFKEITDANKLHVSKQVVLYFLRKKEIKTKMIEELADMIQLAKWTDTIGNFILIPETRRGERGENVYKNYEANDRMDIYLANLKEHYKEHYDEKKFIEYINQNYLWDYVDRNYRVISLFLDSDNKNFEMKLPDDPECYRAFAKKIISNIKRRGMFMEILIRLSTEVPKQFEKVKDTRNMNSYAEVIEEIETVSLSDTTKSLINKLQRKKD